MVAEANVGLISNVFPMGDEWKNDAELLAQVRGRASLERVVEAMLGIYGGYRVNNSSFAVVGRNSFSSIHVKEWEEGNTCSRNKSGEHTHGPVLDDGQLKFVCRCTKKTCPDFHACRSDYVKIAPEIFVDNHLAEANVSPVSPMVMGKRIPPATLVKTAPDVSRETGAQPKPESRGKLCREREQIGTVFPDKKAQKILIKDETKNSIVNEEPVLEQTAAADRGTVSRPTVIVPKERKSINSNPDVENMDPQATVVTSDETERLLVLAPPGTGKTHVLIEKIKHLTMERELIPADEILLLCFSRAAVGEIKSRLHKAVAEDGAHDDIGYLNCRTFDSFATSLLRQDDPNIDISAKSYDSLIEMAIELIRSKPDTLSSIKHFIVDEIQDLVAVRAELVRTMILALEEHAGFTLLGDHLQAIYDFQIAGTGKLSSKDFLSWVRSQYKDIKEYRFERNFRQTSELFSQVEIVRKLVDEIGTNPTNGAIEKFGSYCTILPEGQAKAIIEDVAKDEKVALLCRTNGQALKVAEMLMMQDGGKDFIFRKKNQTILLPPWISTLFYDWDQGTMSSMQFADRCSRRLTWGEKEIEAAWQLVKRAEGGEKKILELAKFRRSILHDHRLFDDLAFSGNSRVTVSTIHRAKGREFDVVGFTAPETASLQKAPFDESKVYYVAITRARHTIKRLSFSKHYLNQVTDSYGEKRWISFYWFFDKEDRTSKRKLNGIETGLSEDINPWSFADDKIFSGNDALIGQQYIRESISPGDCLEIVRADDKRYYLTHGDVRIARMGSAFVEGLFAASREIYGPRCRYVSNRFENIYVNQLISIVRDPQSMPTGVRVPQPYSETGFWFGVDVIGLAKPSGRWTNV